jgi:predicted metal-binding protein
MSITKKDLILLQRILNEKLVIIENNQQAFIKKHMTLVEKTISQNICDLAKKQECNTADITSKLSQLTTQIAATNKINIPSGNGLIEPPNTWSSHLI